MSLNVALKAARQIVAKDTRSAIKRIANWRSAATGKRSLERMNGDMITEEMVVSARKLADFLADWERMNLESGIGDWLDTHELPDAERDLIITALRALAARLDDGERLPPIEWRADCFGKSFHALFLGGLYVGSIMQATHSITQHPGEWRGWFMDDDDGNETGWFVTADEARASVEAKLRAALARPAPVAEPTFKDWNERG